MTDRSRLDPSLMETLQHHSNVSETGFVNGAMSIDEAIKEDMKEGVPVDPFFEGTEEKAQVNQVSPPVDSSNVQESVPVQQVQENLQESPPEDPAERFEWTVQKMNQTFPNSPSKQQMLQWKQMHKDLFVCNFNQNVFVYRFLKRIEWSQAQATVRFDQMNKLQTEEWFFDKCLLFPASTVEFKANLPAGLISMLAEQIQMQSGFMNPEYLSDFTVKI